MTSNDLSVTQPMHIQNHITQSPNNPYSIRHGTLSVRSRSLPNTRCGQTWWLKGCSGAASLANSVRVGLTSAVKQLKSQSSISNHLDVPFHQSRRNEQPAQPDAKMVRICWASRVSCLLLFSILTLSKPISLPLLTVDPLPDSVDGKIGPGAIPL